MQFIIIIKLKRFISQGKISTCGTVTSIFAPCAITDGEDIQLLPSTSLDREGTDSHSCKMHAVDRGETARTATCDIEITIGDVNDNTPVFDETYQIVNVSRDLQTGATVDVNMAIKDDDVGANARVTFKIGTYLYFTYN